jgi:biopolymer transport protein ExbB/TolQ
MTEEKNDTVEPSPAPAEADEASTPVAPPAEPAPSIYDSISRIDSDVVVLNREQPQSRVNKRVTSDVRSWVSLALAIPLYGLVVGGAHAAPRDISRLLLERGWIPHVIMALSCWCLSILVVKAVALKVQRKAFKLDLLPKSTPRISAENVTLVIDYIEGVRKRNVDLKASRSFLVERVLRILEHFAARGDVSEIAAVNTADADADAAAVASSFSLVKVLVWAIPILGFIGTVVGISVAVGGFSQSLEGAEQLDTIKSSLGEVTSGLAVAFDTTLVALVASIFVMLPTSWVQKAEEQLVNDVDDFCVTNILRRLVSQDELAAEEETSGIVEEVATADELRLLVLETVANPLAEMLAANAALMKRLTDDQAALGGMHATLSDQLTTFANVSREIGPQVGRAVEQLGRATQMAEQSTDMFGRTSEQLCRELGASRQLMQLLAAGLGSPAGIAPAPQSSVSSGASGANGTNGTNGSNGSNGKSSVMSVGD